MARFAAIYGHFLNVLRAISGIVVFAIFVLIVVDVFVRLVGLPPWLYSSILVEYGLLWFTMLAAPYLVRIKGHVYIDAVTQMLPPAAQRVFAKIAYVICIASSVVFAYYSWTLLVDAYVNNQIDTRAVDMPLWSLLFPIPFCFVLVALEFLRFLIGIDSMYGDRTDVRDSV